ncbi:MAG TPA: hypothetical protein ENN39_07940 [Desulfonatronum sp.]|nr:hypothetical protein [Desulfonatronum sp.]
MTENAPKGLHPLIRGAIIGGSIGLMAVWFGMDPARSFFLGVCCGLLGAFTAHRIQQNRKK